MERFGKSIWSCRDLMATSCLLLATLCLLQQTRAYNIVPRVRSNGDVLHQGSNGDYYVLYGWSVRISCFCFDDQAAQVRHVQLRLEDELVTFTDVCDGLPLELVLTNVNAANEGYYECVTELINGSLRRTSAGFLRTISPSIIEVPQNQFGLLNSEATLNCSVRALDLVVSFRWMDPLNSLSNGRISNVALGHEGEYMCEVFLSDLNLVVTKPVHFTVIVPPRITSNVSAVTVLTFNRNENQSLTVNFESKMSNQTHISWYKNNISLQDSIPERHDVRNESLNSQTALIFEPIRRSHRGQYRVVIENTHGIIPPDRRFVEAYFMVNVSIPPATPTNLSAEQFSTRLTWSLTNVTSDDSADNLTIKVSYKNGSLAMNRQVNGDVRELQLSLIPGQSYLVEISAQNQDGIAVSEEYAFQTLPGAPLVSAVEVRRSEERNNTLHIVATLAYTGGGTILHFIISFRHIGDSDWMQLDYTPTAIPADDSQLVWTAQMTDDRFQQSGIELQVTAVSSNNHNSNLVEQPENIVLPGAPESVVFVSSDTNSVVLRLVLSTVGTAPLTHLELEILSPEYHVLNITEYVLILGGTVDLTLYDLQDGTTYVISIAVHNYGGKGVPSQLLQVNTVSSPPLAVEGIALVAVCSAILLVTIAVIVAIIWSRYYTMKNKQRAYSVAQAENGQLQQSNHKIVKQQSIGSATSPLSTTPGPATPSTATSLLTPRPSPPAFNPTPPYCSSSVSFLPSSNAGRMTSGTHLPPSSFKFDAGSSRSNSVNQDSDLSESNSPRYTYTFPHSEGSPHITSAYEQVDVDLPLDNVEPFEGAMKGLFKGDMKGSFEGAAMKGSFEGAAMKGPFEGAMKGPFEGAMKGVPRAHYSSHDFHPARRVSTTSHQKMVAYMDTDSPHLRTQSNHSVATTQTRLTSSDGSTRESLAYPSNTTNV